MKTVKTLLSVAAVVCGVAGALATMAFDEKPLAKIQVTLPGAPDCDQTGFCTEAVGVECKIAGPESANYKVRTPNGTGFSCMLDATGTWSEE